jgi:uncharacterized membrane protein YphA (DoxX/SURF4 family)
MMNILPLPCARKAPLGGAVLILALRLLVAAVFLIAAVPKIINPQAFALAVFRYQMVPYGMVNLIAILLPWVELIAALALVAPNIQPAWRAGGGGILLVLLFAFTAAIAFNIYRGVDMACGCFSVNPDVGKIGWLSIARNAVLITLTAWLLISDALKQVARHVPV